MNIINTNLGERSYPIYISSESLHTVGLYIKKTGNYNKVIIISDDNVATIYLKTVTDAIRKEKILCQSFIISPGEKSKSLSMADKIYSVMLEANIDRKSAVIALGGGVVGDLAGFAASTFMRGIDFIQIPTSLLAQVDSSVGGKVAVNHPMGKNIIGTFYQPKMVFIDVAVLQSLPTREFASGMSEVIKYGIVMDSSFFSWLEEHLLLIKALNSDMLSHIVTTSCHLKTYIVQEDEEEHGIRALLNFGHTIGHAIESATHYMRFTHGEGVAIGMIYAMKIAASMGWIPTTDIKRVMLLLQAFNLPISFSGTPADELIALMRHDKKSINGDIIFILPTSIGIAKIYKQLDIELLKTILNNG